jgi:polyadenylate-binding protein
MATAVAAAAPEAAPAPAAAGNNANPGAPAASASLYVGDLAADVLERDLFEIFAVVGPIYSIRVLRDSVSRRSLGYAYVNFSNVQDAERALDTLNYTSVKNRPIRIMWKQRDPALRRSGVGNVFIKNLDESVDSRTLHDTFSQFGNIISCKVVCDENDKSRGFGFVQFQTKEEAELAIEKVNGNKIMDKQVTVMHFKPAAERPASQYSNLFVKNFEKNVTDEQLEKAFTPFGKILSAKVQTDSDGNSRGFGYVQYETHEAAAKAVEELNEKPIFGDMPVYCGPHMKRNRRIVHNRKVYETKRQERLAKQQGNNLYVKYLDETCTDDKLREEFEKFGSITSAKVATDEKGQCKGYGFVCFSSPEEATRAVTEMNGKMLGSKPLFVALHQSRHVRQAQLNAQNLQRQQQMMGRFAAPYNAGMPFMYAQRPGMMMVPGAPMGGRQFGYQQQRGPFMAGAHGRPQRNPYRGNQRQGVPQGAPGMVPAPVGPTPQQAGVQFKGNVRNPQRPAAAPVAGTAAPAESFAAKLASASPDQRKQMLGERLYMQIAPEHQQLAGKITGMLLDGLAEDELMQLIEDPKALREKVKVALEALERHSSQQASE